MEGSPPNADTAGVPFPPPLAYLAGLLIGLALEFAFPTDALPTAVTIAGAVLGVGASVMLDLNAMRRFTRARTPAIPSKPSTALVTSGPYRITRNPGWRACMSRSPSRPCSRNRSRVTLQVRVVREFPAQGWLGKRSRSAEGAARAGWQALFCRCGTDHCVPCGR